jgi:hypothetical protein
MTFPWKNINEISGSKKQKLEARKGLFSENGHRDDNRLSDGIIA